VEVELEEEESVLEVESNQRLAKTKDLIKRVKQNLKPYWKSMKDS